MTNTTTTERIPYQAYGVLIAGIIAVSLSAVFIRMAQNEGVPSLLIAAARLTIAAALLTLPTWSRYAAQIRRLGRADLLLAGTSGVFLALHFATWIASLEYVTVLVSVVLVTTSPLWVALLEVAFLRARLGRVVVIGLIVAFCGGLVIGLPAPSTDTSAAAVNVGSAPVLGGTLALIGAIAVAVYFIIGRKLRANLPLLPYIWLVYGCAALTLIVVLIFARIPITGYSGSGYFWLLMLGLVPQLIGHSSFNYGLRYFPATYISVASQLEPIFSAIMALILFSEIPGGIQIVGSVVILFGVLIATLGQARKPQPAETSLETNRQPTS